MLILLMAGCENEPYVLFPLAVSTVTTATTNSSYTYSQGRIRTFMRTTQTDTTSMEFHYSGEGIDRIIADSTEESYKLIQVTGPITHPTLDLTFLITPALNSEVLQQTRRFTYNDNMQLTGVSVSSWDETGMTETTYELAWDGNNVVEIRKQTVDPLGVESQTTLTAAYDNKPGVYSSGAAYIYTIKLDELYWLSANNPISLDSDTFDDVVFMTITYNSFDYPALIRSDRGLLISHSYIEMR
jgi:hypothetical protein